MSTATDGQQESGNSIYAALARTATRSITLYFSRPVRLFRPQKISGWHSLRSHASRSGASLTPTYLTGLVREQGVKVIAKHFIPPMVVNALLGTVLWTTYFETHNSMKHHLGSHPIFIATCSGAVAGSVQAVVAAPAENARLIVEGGSGHGWSHAWQEVFRSTASRSTPTGQQKFREVRQVREWMKEVGSMAGRGWYGWHWGVAKDTCGFAAFFAVFEITRHAAARIKTSFHRIAGDRRHLSRIVHGMTLITGGVVAGLAYEMSCRPWDVARKVIHVDKVTHVRSPPQAVIHKLQTDGFLAFFGHSGPHTNPVESSTSRRRVFALLRTLGRVGPWGVAFLVWEALGPGIS